MHFKYSRKSPKKLIVKLPKNTIAICGTTTINFSSFQSSLLPTKNCLLKKETLCCLHCCPGGGGRGWWWFLVRMQRRSLWVWHVQQSTMPRRCYCRLQWGQCWEASDEGWTPLRNHHYPFKYSSWGRSVQYQTGGRCNDGCRLLFFVLFLPPFFRKDFSVTAFLVYYYVRGTRGGYIYFILMQQTIEALHRKVTWCVFGCYTH